MRTCNKNYKKVLKRILKPKKSMARIRTIKPQFWDDLKLSKLTRDARLLYIGIWNFCDDLGVIPADPHYSKSKVFPYDQIQTQQYVKWLEELRQKGFINLFSLKGEEFYYLPSLLRHQRIDRPNFKDVFVKKEALEACLGTFDDCSTIDLGSIDDASCLERKGEERKVIVMESKVREPLSLFDEAFDSFLEMRKKINKPATETAKKLLKEKLERMAGGDEALKIKILEQSIVNSWQDVYALKNQNYESRNTSTRGNSQSLVPTGSGFGNL